jgi:hypothetical protein
MWHLTVATRGRVPLFPLERRLAAVRLLVRVAPRTLLFEVADDHLHLAVKADRRAAGGIASGMARALAAFGAAPLQPVHFKEIDGRSHLERLIPYFVRQGEHHGLQREALDAGSVFADLIGARVLPGFDLGLLHGELPRLDLRAEALDALEYGFRAIAPAPSELIRELGADAVWKSAIAAAALDRADGVGPEMHALRVAWVKLANDVGWNAQDARETARIATRTWFRLVGGPPQPALEGAIRTRIAFAAADRATWRRVDKVAGQRR